jgi:thiamine biosynthesis lipoprotein
MPTYTIRFHAMGSTIQAWISAPDADSAQVLEQVPILFEIYEQCLSRFRPDSDLCDLNNQAGQWVKVSPVLFDVIRTATVTADLTDGLVTPLVLPALEAAGYTSSFDPTTFVAQRAPAVDHVPHWREIKLDSARMCVRIPPGARLDLGGVGKGWAAQHVASYLSEFGPCLVDAGGDIVARGVPDGSDDPGWWVTVPAPNGAADEGRLLLHNAAIATSGVDYRQWVCDGFVLHHLIDPRTAQPAETEILSATVVYRDIIWAEALAKLCLLNGQMPASEEPVLLVYRDGSTCVNKAFNQKWRKACQNVE